MTRTLLATAVSAFMALAAGEAEAGNCRDFTRTIDKRGYVEVQRGVECWRWNGWQTVSLDTERYYDRYADNFYYGGRNGYSASSASFLNINVGNARPKTVIIDRRDRHDRHDNRGNHGNGRGHGHDRHDHDRRH